MANNKLSSTLSQNFLEILDDDDYYYDIAIEVGRNPDIRTFNAHMVILHYRCPYIRRLLSIEKGKYNEDLTQIRIPNISPEIFQVILRYIYGGKLSLQEYDITKVVKILIASNELRLQDLDIYLQSYLIESKPNWTQQNYNLIFRTSFEDDTFLRLQYYCADLISQEPDKILKSLNFSSMPEKLLISFIQNDHLHMSEIQVWENVLKWGLAQNGLPSDPMEFTRIDFNNLKDSLEQFIPFIRFYNFTSKEFSDKVLPYKKIIPRGVYNDLLKHFLNNNNNDDPDYRVIEQIRSKPIESRIITSQHAELISKWIDKLKITDKLTNPYEFKLLFRGSRDGPTPGKFHELCNNKPRTVSIVKVKGINEILGGYNPISWKSSGGYFPNKDSFIFSFKNEKIILSRVKEERKAVRNDSDIGPSFGMGDLTINWGISWTTGNCSCKRASYEKPIRETEGRFFSEEYEVFQIDVRDT